MADFRIAIAVSLAILATGVRHFLKQSSGASAGGSTGTYSIGISRGATSALLSSSAGEAAIGDAVAQAVRIVTRKGKSTCIKRRQKVRSLSSAYPIRNERRP